MAKDAIPAYKLCEQLNVDGIVILRLAQSLGIPLKMGSLTRLTPDQVALIEEHLPQFLVDNPCPQKGGEDDLAAMVRTSDDADAFDDTEDLEEEDGLDDDEEEEEDDLDDESDDEDMGVEREGTKPGVKPGKDDMGAGFYEAPSLDDYEDRDDEDAYDDDRDDEPAD